MRKKKSNKLFIIIGFCAVLAVIVVIIVRFEAKHELTNDFYLNESGHDYHQVEPVIRNGLVLFNGSSRIMANGEIAESNAAPFLQNGVMYASVNEAVNYLNAQIARDNATNIISIESNKFKSYFMPDFNIILLNNEPVVMPSKPVEKNGHIFLPVDIIATAMNVPCFRDYSQGVAVLRGAKPLKDEDYIILMKQAGLKVNKPMNNKELDNLTAKSGRGDIYSLSRASRLYVSDAKGKLFKWVLLDDFSLSKTSQDVAFTFPSDTAFISGEGKNRASMYMIGSDEPFSPTPDEIAKNDLRYSMGRFVKLKFEQDNSPEQLKTFRDAVRGNFDNRFISNKTNDLQNGTYDGIVNGKGTTDIDTGTFRADWEQLCKKAAKGDVVLLRNKKSDDRYGYFNHAALIIDVDANNGKLRVLQARSPELGVGADLPMDYITIDSFRDDSYWNKYDVAVLGKVNGVNFENGNIIANKAYAHFKDYTFGYGKFFGTKQTTCVDLINDSLKLGDVEMISDKEYRSKLKRALNGEAESLVLLPDDIALSDNVKIVSYLER